MDYKNILKLWEKNKCFIVENDRIKPKKYIYTPFFRANSNGFNNADVRRLIACDVMARFYRFTYNNVLFPTGYNTLANTAFLETRRLNDINDISEIFYNQMIRLGIGINPNKDIKMNSNEYLSLLQYSFIDLYERGYIKYDYCDCYYDDLNNKIFDRINKPSLLPQSNIKSFYLDISNVVDNIVEKINSLNVLDETKSEMIDFLNPKSYLSINLSVSSGEELNIKMSNPELLGGISYILINPEHFDITNYIDPNEELSIISFLNDDNSNDVVFTGTFAKNPLTGADIPVFISLLFDKPYHLGIPDVDMTDREFAISNDLDIVRIIEDGKLIESDFISGYSQEEARSLIIDAFIDADIAIKEEVYEHTKILISSLDNYGALFPFLEDNNEIHSLKDYLPYVITEKLRAELDSDCDVVGSTMKGTINNLYIDGINPILAMLYDDIGFVTSIFSEEAKTEYENWSCIDYLCIKDSVLSNSLFMQLTFQAILESELGIKFNTPNKIVRAKGIVDDSGVKIAKWNNNIINFDKLLNNFYADSIRLFSLSTNLEDEFVFSGSLLKEIDELTNNLLDSLLIDYDSKRLEFDIYELSRKCINALNDKDVCSYVNLLLEFFKTDFKGFKDEHALTLIKLIYPICPFISEEVFKRRFNGKYSIVNEDFVE